MEFLGKCNRTFWDNSICFFDNNSTEKDTVNDTHSDTVNDTQNLILSLLTLDPQMTVKAISAELEINERDVKKISR